MEKQHYYLSTEEYSFLLSILNMDELAAMTLRSTNEEEDFSERDIEIIMKTAMHSLLSKGYLLGFNEENPEQSVIEPLKKFLLGIETTNRVIRGYIEDEQSTRILLTHLGTENFLHLSSDNIVHEFVACDPHDICGIYEEFFYLSFVDKEACRKTVINQAQFDELIDYRSENRSIQSFVDKWNIRDEVLLSFINDFMNIDSYMNVSYTPKELGEDEGFIEDIFFLVNMFDYTWVIFNEQRDGQVEPSIKIEQLTTDRWKMLFEPFYVEKSEI